jgi:hypothetical protein
VCAEHYHVAVQAALHNADESPTARHAKCGRKSSGEISPSCQHHSRKGGTCVRTMNILESSQGFE